MNHIRFRIELTFDELVQLLAKKQSIFSINSNTTWKL